MPANSSSPYTSQTSGCGSFFSLLQQSSAEESSNDSGDSTSNQPPQKKNSDPAAAATVDATLQQPAPADTLPLPTRLSFNFGPRSEAAKSESNKERRTEHSQNGSAAPADSIVPGSMAEVAADNQHGADSVNAKGGPTDQDNPRVDAEQKPVNASSASTLAFALRLTPEQEHTQPAAENGHIKGADSPNNVVNGGAQAAQSERPSTGADSNADNRHAANQQSDSGAAAADGLTAAPAAQADTSYQAVHIAAADGPASMPAAASAPAPAQASQVAAHVPVMGHADVPAKTGTASELTFSVSAADQQKVEVRVMDRAGEVRVSVRAPNEELASTLRTDLGSLTGRLNQSGFATEAFAPASHGGEFSRGQSNNGPSDQQQNGGQDRNAGRQNQPQDSQQDGRGKRPAWLDEFENSMANGPVRKDAR